MQPQKARKKLCDFCALRGYNLFWGMQFRTCGKFRVFADSKSSLTPEIFHKYKSHTAIISIVVAFSHESKKSVIARKFCKAKFSWQSTK